MSLLEVEDLRIRYARQGRLKAALRREPYDFEAVCGVSFTLGAGETLGLVGESGSGKSTIARTLIGLKKASGGSIRFDGAEISEASAREWSRLRTDMSMMWQDPVGSLSPRLTVKSLVTEPLRIHGRPAGRGEAERLLGLVGLPAEFATRYPHQLSGGQARRVGVARALALDPRLLIADEPTAGLDMSVQGEVLNLLADVQARSGVAIVIITHNLNLVRHVTDQMAIMYLGRFVEKGPTDRVFAHPRHPYTKALLAANPEPDPDARHERVALDGEVPSPVNRPSGCDFHPRCPWAQATCAVTEPSWTDEDGRGHRCLFPL
ncbi:ABC transporter ATP-binding protein [Roseovarius atlanticus]|uniref:oligopeptide/dipeptide ABC transporter ATP-binding protein n=1 Tax=Roseovarius atlanticus TaxID=1641875 RepID=UPI001C9618F0|nr:ABC transporter ATP-binding protein [Roseovarius atlanticus]MBY5987691.1 ABC transporter ATP-binding protein [Roseovarius atlanticus]MBY6123082.1 ABC transporter ATP-binding protein [Roseovarius atlanticus]MBY6147578.1 ABC transporter ATP-binding protein [Roseovarius atlanticus]